MTVLQDAISELGVVEGKGSANDPRVLEYHRLGGGGFSQDSVPWCGSFIGWLMHKNKVPFDKAQSSRARYWLTWGYSLKGKPIPGAVGVVPRGGPATGHVFLFVRWLDKAAGVFEAIGGNQSGGKRTGHDGAVTLTRMSAADVLDWRWHKAMPLPTSNQPLKKSAVVHGGIASGTVGGGLVVANAPALAEALQKADSATSTNTILGALAGAVIIGAAVWIIVARINSAKAERKRTGA